MTDAKIADHRERLIFCLSLEDQVVDHMLFGDVVLYEVEACATTNSKVGWSPLPGGFRSFYHSFSLDDVMSVDKRAWDWTMPAWVIQMYFDQRFGHLPVEFRNAIWRRFSQVVGPECILRLPDGRRLQQVLWGLMKSGWILTIGLNSSAQVYQHYLACIRAGVRPRLLWAMGDDVVVRSMPPQYFFFLTSTGCLVKHVKKGAEFCGLAFLPGGVLQPLYAAKHKFNIAYCDPDKLSDMATGLGAWYALAADSSVMEPIRGYSRFSRRQFRWWAMGLLELDFNWK